MTIHHCHSQFVPVTHAVRIGRDQRCRDTVCDARAGGVTLLAVWSIDVGVRAARLAPLTPRPQPSAQNVDGAVLDLTCVILVGRLLPR